MKTKIIYSALVIALVMTMFAGCAKNPPNSIQIDNNFDLNAVNEIFKLKFESDAKIIDYSLTPSSSGDSDDPEETVLKVILEFPAEKNDAYYKMIDGKFALLTSEEELTEYTAIFENIFSPRSIALDAMFHRFEITKTEERFLFWGTETYHRGTTLAGIEYGESSTTVYLHTVVYMDGDKIIFAA